MKQLTEQEKKLIDSRIDNIKRRIKLTERLYNKSMNQARKHSLSIQNYTRTLNKLSERKINDKKLYINS